MDGSLNSNDISKIVEADRAHVWHHLIQHKPFETIDPRIIVEGKGIKVWDQNGKEHLDGVSGGVWTVNVEINSLNSTTFLVQQGQFQEHFFQKSLLKKCLV